jgi:adenosine deaminase
MVVALDHGFGEVEGETDVTVGLCVSLSRSMSAVEANEVIDEVIGLDHSRVVALSIDGDESAGSHNDRFAASFTRAREAGLHRCAHAGESSGAAGVREAVELLGAERIDHGVRCIEDPALMQELAARRIPLDVCPTSNVILGVTQDLASHPIDRLRRNGVPVSVNTDDPLLFGIDLAGEYERCARTFGWGVDELASIARTSLESCFADDGRKSALLAELDRYLDRTAGTERSGGRSP